MKIFWKRFFTIGGWFTWVLAAVAVGTAVYSGVSANQAKKKAQGQAGAADKANQAALKNREMFVAPPAPEYVSWPFKSNQKRAIEEDTNAYARSDADFKRRHAPTVQAEKLFEEGVLKDQVGEHELLPALQNEYMRAGMTNALNSLGTGTTGPTSIFKGGGAGEAALARHLGESIDKRQQQNRTNRMASLNMAEEIFPRRTFGMNGADYVQSSIADVSNKNAWASANYERAFEAEKARIGQQAEIANASQSSRNAAAQANALANAERDKAVAQAVSTGVQGAAGAYGGYAAKAGTGATTGTAPSLASTGSYVPAQTNAWQANARGR